MSLCHILQIEVATQNEVLQIRTDVDKFLATLLTQGARSLSTIILIRNCLSGLSWRMDGYEFTAPRGTGKTSCFMASEQASHVWSSTCTAAVYVKNVQITAIITFLVGRDGTKTESSLPLYRQEDRKRHSETQDLKSTTSTIQAIEPPESGSTSFPRVIHE